MLSPKKSDTRLWLSRTKFQMSYIYRTSSVPQRVGAAVGLTLCVMFLLFASRSLSRPSLASSAKSAPVATVFRNFASEFNKLQSRTDLSIVTVVSRMKMANLRELVGSIHLHCSKCHVVVYGFDLTSDQITEIRNWDRVALNDAHRDLLSAMALGYDRSFNIVQSAIIHALQSRDRILYLSVDYTVSNSLDSVDNMLKEKGHVFAVPDDNLESADEGTRRVLKHIQGYSKNSQAYTDVALKLSEYPCAPLPTLPCMVGARIDLPRVSSHQYTLVPISDLPFVPQRLEDQTIVMHFRSEANANTDPADISFSSKAFHTELETFANANFAYMRFDLSGIHGNIHSAQLELHPAWLHDPAHPTESSAGQAAICLADNSRWDERGIRWSERPTCSGDAVHVGVHDGFPSVGDVTLYVQSVVSDKSTDPSSKHLTLMVRSNSDMWIKYHSRFSPRTELHPRLRVMVSGQGANHQHIRTVSSLMDGGVSLVEIEDKPFA